MMLGMFLIPLLVIGLLGMGGYWLLMNGPSGRDTTPEVKTAPCPHCRQPIQPGWKACPSCGGPLV